jgi:hypothetical protein
MNCIINKNIIRQIVSLKYNIKPYSTNIKFENLNLDKNLDENLNSDKNLDENLNLNENLNQNFDENKINRYDFDKITLRIKKLEEKIYQYHFDEKKINQYDLDKISFRIKELEEKLKYKIYTQENDGNFLHWFLAFGFVCWLLK